MLLLHVAGPCMRGCLCLWQVHAISECGRLPLHVAGCLFMWQAQAASANGRPRLPLHVAGPCMRCLWMRPYLAAAVWKSLPKDYMKCDQILYSRCWILYLWFFTFCCSIWPLQSIISYIIHRTLNGTIGIPGWQEWKGYIHIPRFDNHPNGNFQKNVGNSTKNCTRLHVHREKQTGSSNLEASKLLLYFY